MAQDTSHGTTVLVENSDDRLAVAEEAKRSGEALRSVGANVTVPVPASVAIGIANDHLKDETYTADHGATFPSHLEEFHEMLKSPDGNDYVVATNEMKAQEHEAYSADLVRARMKEEAENQKRLAEGYRFDLAINESNMRRAEEHEAANRDWAKAHKEATDKLKTVQEVTDAVTAHTANLDVIDDKKVAEELKGVNEVPDTSESSIKEGLKIKDQLISGQRHFVDAASDPEKTLAYDHPAVPIMEEAGSPEGLVNIRQEHLAAKAEAYGEVPGDTKEATERKADYLDSVNTESGKEAAENDGSVNDEKGKAQSVDAALAEGRDRQETRLKEKDSTDSKAATVEDPVKATPFAESATTNVDKNGKK